MSTDELLTSRRLLAECGDWVAVPHSCPCLMLPTSATRAAQEASHERHGKKGLVVFVSDFGSAQGIKTCFLVFLE